MVQYAIHSWERNQRHQIGLKLREESSASSNMRGNAPARPLWCGLPSRGRTQQKSRRRFGGGCCAPGCTAAAWILAHPSPSPALKVAERGTVYFGIIFPWTWLFRIHGGPVGVDLRLHANRRWWRAYELYQARSRSCQATLLVGHQLVSQELLGSVFGMEDFLPGPTIHKRPSWPLGYLRLVSHRTNHHNNCYDM